MVRRRALLASLPPFAAPALAQGFEWPALAAAALAPIRAGLGPGEVPVLLKSWQTQGTATDFDRTQNEAAYTYDNALAGLALLAAGEAAAAARIGEGLRLAQTQDRFWRDGRLRNAYAAGVQHPDAPASARPPGWWDAAQNRWLEDGYQAGSAAGPVAFAILLWAALDRPPFRAAAERAADWLETLRAAAGFRGGAIGHEPDPAPLAWRSTEQNTDIAAAFSRIGRTAPAAHAADFVRAMWAPAEQRFFAGRLPDGGINGASALDANLFPLLALPNPDQFRPALDWVLTRHGLPAGTPVTELDGFDFNDDRDGIWLEGTAQAALALRSAGRAGLAERLGRTLLAQRGPGGWIMASSVASLSTGLGTGLRTDQADFRYPRRGHLAANAWAVLAALGCNPF